MPYTHHSHSGQFCAHAKGTLEEVIRTAIEKKMQVVAMTEHMPREQQDLYPEETAAGYSDTILGDIFEKYYVEARRLQKIYSTRMSIFVGMEIDWIRPSSQTFVQDLLSKYPLELFIGSVHHVHGIPIDYDTDLFRRARQVSGGTDEKLFEDYFDLQYEMLKALKPPIVGHFDLIRLKSDHPNTSFADMKSVWEKIHRNLGYTMSYGGVLELNSAALRKGMKEPYPNAAICKVFLDLDGAFTISDDSHGLDQIGTHYRELLQFAKQVGVVQIAYLEKGSVTRDPRFANISFGSVGLSQLQSHPHSASCVAA
ncbi:MAG: hypothetical protein Q9183_000220 [Haloplaca sp. 2 TL-2023]